MTDDDDQQPCEWERVPVEGDEDFYGFTVDEARAGFETGGTGLLTWLGSSMAIEVSPSSGETLIHVDGTFDGPAIYEKLTRPNDGLACSEQILVPATVNISTEDGALAETWQLQLEIPIGSGAYLSLDTNPSFDFAGDLTLDPVEEEIAKWETQELNFTLAYYFQEDPPTTSGSFYHHLINTTPEGGVAFSTEIAQWVLTGN